MCGAFKVRSDVDSDMMLRWRHLRLFIYNIISFFRRFLIVSVHMKSRIRNNKQQLENGMILGLKSYQSSMENGIVPTIVGNLSWHVDSG